MKRTTSPARRLVRAIAPLTLAAIALGACSGSSDGTADTTGSVAPRITVTSVKGDATSELLAAVYARVLEDAGYRVSRKDPVDLDRAGYLAALAKGDFNLIPDWTEPLVAHLYDQPGAPSAPTTVVPSEPATTVAPITVPASSTTVAASSTTVAGSSTTAASTTTLAGTTTSAGSTTTTAPVVITNGRTVPEQIVAIGAALPDGVAIGNPTDGEDKTVIACTAAVMKANENTQFVTYTRLASVAPTIRLAGSAEWMKDEEFGYPAFQQYYGGDFKDTVTVEDADVEAAIADDSADCFALNSLDGVITRKQLTILEDDKAMVRGNAAVPVLTEATATADLVQVLSQVNNALTSAKLNQMINEIVTNGTDPVVVANAFLDTQGSVTSSTLG